MISILMANRVSVIIVSGNNTCDEQNKSQAIGDVCSIFILGRIGGWKDVLTEDMSKRVDEMLHKELGDTGLIFD